MPITTQYQTVTPYLIVEHALSFLTFMQELFDAEIKEKHFRDEKETTLMHAELKIGNACIMCAEATEQWKTEPAGLFIYVENADTSYAKALELGCTSIMELSDQSYGRTCGVKDSFGNTWWITSV
ncbi:MAG: VOC family protein [Chitinophagales bacterium]